MDLIEVDRVDLQPRQARVDGLRDYVARQVGAAVANPVAATRAGHLGRDDEPIAWTPRQPVAEKNLGAALRRRVRRHRIHLSGVDEVDPLRDRVVELRVCLGLAVLLAPGHGAEANLGDLELGARERTVFHCGSRLSCKVS